MLKTNVKKSIKEKIPKKDSIETLLKRYNLGIKLDIGCGPNKEEGFIGIDVRDFPTVDIVHNIEKFPWPLPDNSVSLAISSHVLEHINPGSTDPRLVGLIKLLRAKKMLTDKEIAEYIGE